MEEKIAELEKKVRLLIQNNSKWKRKYETRKGKQTRRQTRTLKAERLVQRWIDGDRSKTFRQIAEECYLSIETIKNISYKIRHKNDKSKKV